MSDRDAHVVEERRHDGTRDGEHAWYAVGEIRDTFEEARDDLVALSEGAYHGELDALRRKVADLERRRGIGSEPVAYLIHHAGGEQLTGSSLMASDAEARGLRVDRLYKEVGA